MRQEQKLMVGIDQFTLKIYCNTSSSWKTMAKQVIDIFVEKAEFREIHWIESQETHGCSRGYTKAMYICANIGCKVLGYTENDVFSMTLRKFYLIYEQYLEFNGLKKKDEELNLDLF